MSEFKTHYSTPAGNALHVSYVQAGVNVWLNTTTDLDFEGLIIGSGPTRTLALSNAEKTLKEIVVVVRTALCEEGEIAPVITNDSIRYGM